MAVLLTYATTIPFFLDGILKVEVERAISDALKLGSTTVLLFIGAGFFLPGREEGLWGSIRNALKLERREAGDLIREVFSPDHAKEVIDILASTALIDNRLAERERAYVERLAGAWHVRVDWERLQADRAGDLGGAYQRLRDTTRRYLASRPPNDQVRELRDAVAALVKVDEVTTEQERVIAAELDGLFARHLEGLVAPDYYVVVVPASPEQEEALRTVLPEAVREPIAGGDAFVAGKFASEVYAQHVRDSYRELSLLSFVEATNIDPSDSFMHGARVALA